MTLRRFATTLMVLGVWAALAALHYPFRCLPYFWDEAGYYALAALDFYRHGLLIPQSTWPLGHTPLVPIFLGVAWHVAGFSPCVARIAMMLPAAATVVTTYRLGTYVFPRDSGREMAAWSAVLLALSPLYFAQSEMLHIDLPAALFVTLSVLALLRERAALFALAASLAVLTKETAVILLPVAWLFAWRIRRELRARDWVALASPLFVALAWAIYYHHRTGFWTGNREYLQYNLYSTLNPVRFALSLARRFYQLLIGGFNWVLVGGAVFAIWRERKSPARNQDRGTSHRSDKSLPMGAPTSCAAASPPSETLRRFLWLAGGLCTVYVVFHSLVGGAVLRRYLLPASPVFDLGVVWFLWKLPKQRARAISAVAAALFVAAWFLAGPFPHEFESNLAYTDFIRLHEQAARYLESLASEQRILTAWPATGELTVPALGYVTRPLRVVPVDGFGEADFSRVSADSFDLLYLYSRKSEAVRSGLMRFHFVERLNERYFDYEPQVPDQTLVARYHLKRLVEFDRHGQWVRIYAK